MAMRKGQAFILGSVIFTSLVVLTFIHTGPTLLSKPSNTRLFFSQTLEKTPEVMNQAMDDNSSADYLLKRIQSYENFLERKSRERGARYSSYVVIVLPERGEAAVLNQMDRSGEYRLYIDTGGPGNWFNRSLGPEQSTVESFSPGTAETRLIVPSRGEEYSFDAATSRLLKRQVLNSTDENWEKTFIG